MIRALIVSHVNDVIRSYDRGLTPIFEQLAREMAKLFENLFFLSRDKIMQVTQHILFWPRSMIEDATGSNSSAADWHRLRTYDVSSELRRCISTRPKNYYFKVQ